MASSELTIAEIYYYFKEKGGVVKNRDVVHHFKKYLTHPELKDDARAKFKKFVNVLAQTRTENNEKYLYLKTKYLNSTEPPVFQLNAQAQHSRNSDGIPTSPSYVPVESPTARPGLRPPPYRPPPPPPSISSPTPSADNISICSFTSSSFSMFDQENSNVTPQAPPRRRSMDKQKSLEEGTSPKKKAEVLKEEEGEDKRAVSVKERTQKFNRMASVEDELSCSPKHKQNDKSINPKGADEDDGASVTSLEPKKCMEWYVTASKGDFQELVKLAKDEPRLVNKKDPFTTVLHWGAKHGNGDIIKVFAGTFKVDVNGRTGYTPLHIAAQFGHKDIYSLLDNVYKADISIRDYSGRTAKYYLIAKEQKDNKENIRSIQGRKKQSEKDLGFLRIGSLNVRVKRTTEAFSNFLGVGAGTVSPVDSMSEKMHKGWGSADNVNQDSNMPAPKGYLSKRKSKRMSESGGVQSTPTTPKQSTRSVSHFIGNDSDSDTAAGFDSQWKN